MTDDFCIYIIAHLSGNSIVGPVKVGITGNLEKRFQQIRTGNPRMLMVSDSFPMPDRETARALERAFHGVCAAKRLEGEWFDMGPGDALLLMGFNIDAFLKSTGLQPGDGLYEEVAKQTGLTRIWSRLRASGYDFGNQGPKH